MTLKGVSQRLKRPIPVFSRTREHHAWIESPSRQQVQAKTTPRISEKKGEVVNTYGVVHPKSNSRRPRMVNVYVEDSAENITLADVMGQLTKFTRQCSKLIHCIRDEVSNVLCCDEPLRRGECRRCMTTSELLSVLEEFHEVKRGVDQLCTVLKTSLLNPDDPEEGSAQHHLPLTPAPPGSDPSPATARSRRTVEPASQTPWGASRPSPPTTAAPSRGTSAHRSDGGVSVPRQEEEATSIVHDADTASGSHPDVAFRVDNLPRPLRLRWVSETVGHVARTEGTLAAVTRFNTSLFAARADSVDLIVEHFLQDVRRVFECEAAAVYTLDATQAELSCRWEAIASAPSFDSHVRPTAPGGGGSLGEGEDGPVPLADPPHSAALFVGQGLAGACAANGKLVATADPASDPRFDHTTDSNIENCVCVPIQRDVNDAPCSVLQVVNKRPGMEFTSADCELLRTVASNLLFPIYSPEGRPT